MEQVEIQIYQTGGQIQGNFDEVKKYLSDQLEEYRTAVFTDESIKVAKVIVADLRKQQKAFKERITDVKKSYMKPFEEFKAQADELVNLYDEPINFINDQVKDFVERQKTEKRSLIKEIYEDIFSDLKEFTLESIYDTRWENATYKASDIVADFNELHFHIKQEMQTIKAFRSESSDKALEMYKADRNLSKAIDYMQRYEEQREEIERRNAEKAKQEEIERIRREEREKLLAEQRLEWEKEVAAKEAEEKVMNSLIPQEEPGEEAKDYIYSISLTTKSKEALELYMNSIGAEWEILNG